MVEKRSFPRKRVLKAGTIAFGGAAIKLYGSKSLGVRRFAGSGEPTRNPKTICAGYRGGSLPV